jgi:hypothetical protein
VFDTTAALRARLRTACIVALAGAAMLAPSAALAQENNWRTVTSSRQTAGETLLQVEVEYAAGELRIGPGTRGTLYRSTLRYDADVFKPEIEYANSRLHVGIEGNNVRGRNLKSGSLDLRLSPDVPIQLEAAFGAVDAHIDLGGLRIRQAEIATGASNTVITVSQANLENCRLLEIAAGAAKLDVTRLGNLNVARVQVEGGVGELSLDFTGALRNDIDVDIDMGLGSLTLRVPRSVGVRVEKDGLLASFDSQGMVKRGDIFYSENYERTARHIDFNIDAALGSIRIIWVDG